MAQYAENKPTADVLMSSMRSMGYTFEAAIADIVDNSISAAASEIQIRFPVDPIDLFVAVCDNGSGMNRDELFDAMKYGSSLKRGKRQESDLGRFGLGLKSASLSQCRKLTVVSKKAGILSAFTWDLDVVEEKKDWIMLERTAEEIQSLRFIDYLNEKESGTIVVWEDFDIIRESSGNEYAELMEHQSETSNYLSLIFHRYLRLHRPIAKKQIGVVGRGKTAQSTPVSAHAGRTRSDCRATPVSQNQVRQCEQHIQFGGLFSQTSVSRFSIPELPLNDRKYMFYLCPNR